MLGDAIKGVNFVPLAYYLKLKEENQKLKSDLEKFSEAYKRYRDYEKEELAESCYDLERENQKLKAKLEEYENLPF